MHKVYHLYTRSRISQLLPTPPRPAEFRLTVCPSCQLLNPSLPMLFRAGAVPCGA